MTMLTIKDLAVYDELDSASMSGIYGGGTRKTSSSSGKQKSPSSSDYLVITFSDVLVSAYPAPE